MQTVETGMFNLIVGDGVLDMVIDAPVGAVIPDVTFRGDRMFEYTYTDEETTTMYAQDVSLLANLPTLVSDEGRDSPAVYGRISNVKRDGGRVAFQFQKICEGFTFSAIAENKRISRDIKISGWGSGIAGLESGGLGISEYRRNHWSIKRGDLEVVVFDTLEPSKPKSFAVKRWPVPILPNRVAVMMPFSSGFDQVYAAIKSACAAQSMQSVRVDERMDPGVIMDMIFEMIVESRLVICDLTESNPNVMYETGIAHAVGKDVIQITQGNPASDVGFDLRHRNCHKYTIEGSGLDDLEKYLRQSIWNLLNNR